MPNADLALDSAKKLERLHDKLLTSGLPPESLNRIWEAALDLRRVHHSLRTTPVTA